jgi:hypothetical protein
LVWRDWKRPRRTSVTICQNADQKSNTSPHEYETGLYVDKHSFRKLFSFDSFATRTAIRSVRSCKIQTECYTEVKWSCESLHGAVFMWNTSRNTTVYTSQSTAMSLCS